MIPAPSPGIHYPTRESDGEAHVGQMLPLREALVWDARRLVFEHLAKARAYRLAGNTEMWLWEMSHIGPWRRELARRKRNRN